MSRELILIPKSKYEQLMNECHNKDSDKEFIKPSEEQSGGSNLQMDNEKQLFDKPLDNHSNISRKGNSNDSDQNNKEAPTITQVEESSMKAVKRPLSKMPFVKKTAIDVGKLQKSASKQNKRVKRQPIGKWVNYLI